MTLGVPINDAQIRQYLREVADELSPSGPQHVLVVVGGALLAWFGLREATQDVDSVTRFADELADAVRLVAERHDLAPAWVNHHAAAFMPQTFILDDCEVLMERGRLLVLGAPVRQVFLMKMFAGRAQDHEDLVALWPLADFTPASAVSEYWRAYPGAPEDEFLISWVEDIARRSAGNA
jgi:hypothetical protein